MLQVPSRKLTIGYWACRGLGAPLRMVAAYSQTDYADKFYEVGKYSPQQGHSCETHVRIYTLPDAPQAPRCCTLVLTDIGVGPEEQDLPGI